MKLSKLPSSATDALWKNRPFQILFWAHVISLLGTGVGAVALGLLANHLAGASAASVLGFTLATRIVVLVLAAPWAGSVAARFGTRTTLIASDIFRAGIVIGFLFVTEVWQIYVLAVFLNLGAAVFTPVYKATVPNVTSSAQYPRALSLGSIAYDLSNILGPSLAALLISIVGFEGNFVANAFTFIVSAFLLFALPRLESVPAVSGKTQGSAMTGMRAMLVRLPLRESLFLALQVSIAGGFVLVATVDIIKTRLALPDVYYAWAMAAYGVGSVLGAVVYGRSSDAVRRVLFHSCAPMMIGALALVAGLMCYEVVLVAWIFAGAGQCILGIRGNQLLAANTDQSERAHVYAAHFSLSHLGWGITYPLAGLITTQLGPAVAAWLFTVLLLGISFPAWITGRRAGV